MNRMPTDDELNVLHSWTDIDDPNVKLLFLDDIRRWQTSTEEENHRRFCCDGCCPDITQRDDYEEIHEHSIVVLNVVGDYSPWIILLFDYDYSFKTGQDSTSNFCAMPYDRYIDFHRTTGQPKKHGSVPLDDPSVRLFHYTDIMVSLENYSDEYDEWIAYQITKHVNLRDDVNQLANL